VTSTSSPRSAPAKYCGTCAAGAIPWVRLTRIFRRAQQFGIVVNAHRINHGQPPQLTGFGDFYWFTCEPPEDSGLHPAEETARLVVDIVARRVPARFGSTRSATSRC
jgi:exodeoxyribonuclease V alpha subunit